MDDGDDSTILAAQRSSSEAVPKKVSDIKRVLACGTCRKRKLKCDSKRPKCSTCARLGHTCEYDEVRKKSGPKRGYVKSLEARLNQLESLLDQNPSSAQDATTTQNKKQAIERDPQTSSHDTPDTTPSMYTCEETLEAFPTATMHDNDLNLISDFGMPVADFPWDMVSLGLEEPLPSQDIMDDLYQIYFDKIHASLPCIHRPRFMASLKMAPNSRPPVCLRYIIFAQACTADARYAASADQFYQKARKYIEQDEMRGHGESFITVAHAQTWNLIAAYEFRNMYFPRAWLSVGRGGRLVQMLGLQRQDRVGLDVKQTLAPPKDWIDREERRRTFWVAYCNDRYASIGTGWPMMMDEHDIQTTLPASDAAFLSGASEQTPMLSEVMAGESVAGLSAYGSVILLATLFGRNLTHLHRPSADDNDHDLNGEFWKRHRTLDNILLNTALSLPSHLRLPQGINDINVVFCNMNIHTSTICLHQAAIFKADKHKLASQISSESKRRCLVAADQITNTMKMICHQDLSGLNPFMAFCLYVAARVFVQYLKFKKDDLTVRSSLMFLLRAMQAMKTLNPLTESFLVQLDVDLETSGLDIPGPMANIKYADRPAGESPANTETVKCSPLFEIRETQSHTNNPSELAPSLAPDMTFRPTDFDQMSSYFSSSQNGTNITGHIINNGLTPPLSNGDGPGSRQQSNHPTPQQEVFQSRNSIDSGNTPPVFRSMSNEQLQQQQQQQQQQPTKKLNSMSLQDLFSYSSGPKAAGVVIRDFNMSMDDDTDQQSKSNPSLTPNTSQQQQQQSFMDQNFGSTGLTPGPSGYSPWPTTDSGSGGTGMTPGPTGLTPGPGLSGMTPGNSGMGAFTEWQNMNSTDSNDWMFER